MIIENKFDIGQLVFLKTDTDQQARLITSIQVRPNNALMYEVACAGKNDSWHYDFEISDEKDLLTKFQ